MSQRKTRKRKGGFALAETIIALVVILLVSAAALTLVLTSIQVKTHAVTETEARGFASDVWECFKASNNEEQFLSNVEFALGSALPTDQNDAENAYRYIFDRFYAEITVDGVKLTVTATDHKGEEMLSISYEKTTGGWS